VEAGLPALELRDPTTRRGELCMLREETLAISPRSIRACRRHRYSDAIADLEQPSDSATGLPTAAQTLTIRLHAR
jgi:hypothetical protein